MGDRSEIGLVGSRELWGEVAAAAERLATNVTPRTGGLRFGVRYVRITRRCIVYASARLIRSGRLSVNAV
jgi:hypothetical protein